MDENVPELTHWAIRDIINFKRVNRPVLRLIDFQQFSSDDPKSMFVLELSDGDSNYDHCIVETPTLIRRLYAEEFKKQSVVVLNDYHFHKDVYIIYVKDMSIHIPITSTTNESDPEAGPSSEPQQQIETNRVEVNESIRPPVSPTKRAHDNRMDIVFGPSEVRPINTITTNDCNSWVIRGRVTQKTKKRQWNNHNGKGTVFSFVVTDNSGDIRLNAFNRLCDKYFQFIEENKVYRIGEGVVKMADKQFSNLSNDYEIILTADSKVVECPPEEAFCVNVCKPRYRFIPIAELVNSHIGAVVDVIGAVKEVGQCYWITTKHTVNQKVAKRDITLVDNTDTDISLTLWKETAEQFECELNAIIGVQSARLKDFGGRSLTSYPNTNIKIEPDVPEAKPIKEWLSNRQHNTTNESLIAKMSTSVNTSFTPMNTSARKPMNANRIQLMLLDQITEQTISVQKQSIYYVRARVSFPVNRSPLYKSCYKSRCFKKVVELPNGLFRCTKCLEETNRFQWRLFLAAVLIDCTDERWIHLFNAEAARLIGCTAEQLSQYTDQEQYEKVLHSIEYKTYLWKIGAKVQTYLNQTDIKLNVLDFWPMDPIKDSIEMIKNIRKLAQNNG